MASYATCERHARCLAAQLTVAMQHPQVRPLEWLDLFYLRWLAQRTAARCAALRRRSGTRRDLTPCPDRHGALRALSD